MTYRTVEIREIADLYDGPHATPPPSEEGPIFLGIKNIGEDGHLDFSEIRHVSEADFGRWTKRVLPVVGDLVFTYEATLHRYALIPGGFRGCLGRRTALLRPKRDAVDVRFLYYYFRTPEWRAQIESNILRGATVDRIPLTNFPQFKLPLPELATQIDIAQTLGNFDDLIANNHRRMALLETAVHSLYREWFISLRFPGYECAKFVEGLPKGWRRMPITEAVDFDPKVDIPRSELCPFVPMSALSTHSMVVEFGERREAGGGARFENGDTLLARITPCLENGKTGFVQFLQVNEPAATGSTEFIVMRSRMGSPYWVYALARSDEFRGHAINSMSGSDGRQRVQAAALKKFEVKIPPRQLFDLFNESVRPNFELIHNLACQNRLLAEARDLLLPRLMNGSLSP